MTDPFTTEPEHHAGQAPGRRRFLEVLLGSSLAASVVSVLYPVLQFLLPPRASADLDADTVVAAKTNELAPNSAKIFRFGSRPGILVRGADGTYRAFSATCTHLDCTVQYRNREADIWCACHNGVYDLHGRNLSGPPPRPLEAYDVHERGDEIVVARRQKA